MRFFANANYDFLGRRRTAFGLALAFIVIGIVALAVRGVNYSIEFTGGTLVQIETQKPADVGDLRAGLERQGITGAEIQSYGSDREFMIRARVANAQGDANDTQVASAAVRRAVDAVVGQGAYRVVRTEAVGPKVGGELRHRALLAILLSFVVVLAYLAVRFEWRFGVAAIVATAHDIVATIALIALLRLEVSLFVVAALLSIVGYSLNDTIVIFDRVRENLRGAKRPDFLAVLNRSINETLPRTVLTGSTALGTLLMLAVLGGDVIRPFGIIMLFGVVIGTFSSIFIAAPVLYWIEQRWPGPHAHGLKPGATPTERAAARQAQPVA
jgi:preprotein translocase subunit SecF